MKAFLSKQPLYAISRCGMLTSFWLRLRVRMNKCTQRRTMISHTVRS
jgi:hypothetical protein